MKSGQGGRWCASDPLPGAGPHLPPPHRGHVCVKQHKFMWSRVWGAIPEGAGLLHSSGPGLSSFSGPFLNPHPSHGILLLRKPAVCGADVVAVRADCRASRRSRSLSRLVARGGGRWFLSCGGGQLGPRPSPPALWTLSPRPGAVDSLLAAKSPFSLYK